MSAAKAVRRRLENQVKGLGFSIVEVLSPCPTIWKMEPVEAQRFVQEEWHQIFPAGEFPRPHQGGGVSPRRAPLTRRLEELPRSWAS